MKNKFLLMLSVIFIIALHSGGQVTGTYIDSRDGKVYKTVKIGTQTWMADNLNYICNGSQCYKNDNKYCTSYGRLYTCKSAIQNRPGGWHLPTKREIMTLTEALGGVIKPIYYIDTIYNYGDTYDSIIMAGGINKPIGIDSIVIGQSLNKVYDKLINTLNLKLGGMINFDESLDVNERGYYWLYNSPEQDRMYALEIDPFRKTAKIQIFEYPTMENPQMFSILYLKDEENSNKYWELGWKAYEWGEIEIAIDYSKKSIAIDNTLGAVYANLGLFYLIKRDIITANEYYNKAIVNIKKDTENAKYYFKSSIDDINAAITKYPTINGTNEILKKLQSEYDKL